VIEEIKSEEIVAKVLPDVLQYTNYRLYLQDYYQYKKETSRAFSLRFFAEKAGMSSHAHLKLIMDGKRNITKKTVTKMILGLGLNGRRADYFENLVFFNQSDNPKEKKLYYDKLSKITTKSKLHKLDQSQFRIFREWFHIVIREMVTLKNFMKAPELISRKLGSGVSAKQVQESLELLTEAGMLVKTSNGYRQTETFLTTDDEVDNILIRDYHLAMIQKAAESLDTVPSAQRDFSAVCFPIKAEDFGKLKKHIQLMRKELLNFSAKAGEGDDIVQVNIQLYPLTRE
jgi:uncharacterized protein (TIGR02147 family)